MSTSSKKPNKVDQHNISTPKTGIQDLVVTHYDYKLNKIGERKIKPADFKILPAQVQIFSQIRTLQVRVYVIQAKLSDKESFFSQNRTQRRFLV